jgi:signal transduction histidine kinase
MENPDIPGHATQEGTPMHLLCKVSDGVERLSAVIQDIQNVNLIAADRLDLSREPVFVNSVIRSALHNLRGFGPERDLTFDLGSGLRGLPVLEGDPRRLHQALGNVISNAIKSTPDGGTIFIDAETLEGVVHLWVSDTGVGIPPAELRQVFERFYVLGDTSWHRSSKIAFKGGGLGLGLTVAKGIIEAHGGKIWAESPGYDEEKLPGSTFHVLLPIGDPFARVSAESNTDAPSW